MAKRGSGGMDRISGLPDELLHSILLRVPFIANNGRYDILHTSTHAAFVARTSVLSRRWRSVWAHLPELYLFYDDVSDEKQDRIDAALDAYTAPSLDHLHIVMQKKKASRLAEDNLYLPLHLRDDVRPPRVPGNRISKWLRFASQRVTGSLHLEVPSWATCNAGDKDEHQVLLPLSDKIKAATLSLSYHMLHLQIPLLSGQCTELVSLTIQHTRMSSDELENIVSSRCPRLKVLRLECVVLQGSGGFSMQSDSLEKLCLNLGLKPEKGRIQVVAPKLQTLYTHFYIADACISAPVLSEVRWFGHKYDPIRHQIAEAKSYLQRLVTNTSCECEAMALMQRFHTVHELILEVAISKSIQGYKRFLSAISKLSRCEILVLNISYNMGHAFKTTLLAVLRKCAGIRKVVVKVYEDMDKYVCDISGCPCGFPENSKVGDIELSSLEEVEVSFYFGGDDRKLELVKLLYQLSETSRKHVTITVLRGSASANMRKKICSICPPNSKVEIRV